MFTGYSGETLDFLWGIRFNNDRGWFNEHKETYLRCLYRPTLELGTQVQELFSQQFPKLPMNLHVSRIYRDARRLHGRGPYKDHLWFTLRPPQADSDGGGYPVFWFEVSPEGWSHGVGFWCATPAMMAAMRRDMDENPQRLEKLARKLSRQSDFQLQGQEYARPKTAPSPLLQPWYSKKNISIGCDRPFDDLLCSAQLPEAMVKGFAFLVPYYQYFFSFCGGGLEDLR